MIAAGWFEKAFKGLVKTFERGSGTRTVAMSAKDYEPAERTLFDYLSAPGSKRRRNGQAELFVVLRLMTSSNLAGPTGRSAARP